MDTRALCATLEKAKSLLASEDRWIGNEFAADADGRWRPVGSREAVRFSLWGALVRAGASKEALSDARELLERLAPALVGKVRSGTLTYPETVSLLDTMMASLAADTGQSGERAMVTEPRRAGAAG